MQRISDDELAQLAEHNGWPCVRDRLPGHTQEEATAHIVGQPPVYSDGEMRWFQDYLAFLHGPAVRQYRYYGRAEIVSKRTFILEIGLDDYIMQTTTDVAQALRATASYIDGIGDLPDGSGWHLDAGSVRDERGNAVGSWEVSDDAS